MRMIYEDEFSDLDQETPIDYSEDYDWDSHDFDSDPDWR